MPRPWVRVPPPALPATACSGEHFARLLVREDLPLDALQGVVDRLRVAVEILGHVLVGVALEVQRERLRLERREAAAEREDEALELLGRDDADGRVVHARARERVAERAVAFGLLASRCVTER